MKILRGLLIKGITGIAIIAGVGSLITMAILAGVKVAYADIRSGALDDREQTRLEFMRETHKLARDVLM